uniref:DUF4794 domain-containing protein n=1 Tax=Anopheles maculatus TaxID=74869 RepID=A0A182SWT5_9DIPT
MHSLDRAATAYVFLVCLCAFVTAVIAQNNSVAAADDGVTAPITVSMTPPPSSPARAPLLNETELVDLNQLSSTVPYAATKSSLSTEAPVSFVPVDSSSSTTTTAVPSEGTSTTEGTMSPEEIQKLLLPPATVEADILHVNATDDRRPDAKSSSK